MRINRLNDNLKVRVYAKLEMLNPGGSVKDRPALRMIEEAEASGELSKDKILLEATSGNTGIGLAMTCAVKGYRMLFTMSESASPERRKILQAYGADILLTPAAMATDGAIEEAYRLAREEPDKYFLVDQYNNQNNWRAHYEGGTADELHQALGKDLRAVVATIGTSGTVMGLARRMQELNPEARVYGVEPFKGHKIQGLKNMKESYPPGIFDPMVPHAILNIDDDSAYETARRLAREEGIFVGMSSGAAMRVALNLAAELEDGAVVALLPDTGERYLSTTLFASEKTPEPLKVHNTLTRRVEYLNPVNPGRVGIYACGPSLDGPPDLALCRRMAFTDLVRRYLEYRGFGVKLVINLADIDDRTVNQCLDEGSDLAEFTKKWELAFKKALETLGIAPAYDYPRASEHVQDMIDEARQLIEKGLAYEKLRSVYFNISRFPDYGKLSNMDLASIQSGQTVDYDYYDKENPSDFVLFKRSTLAELKAGIYWQTPWGNARPGWHVECATMASEHLGQPFDIHMASNDLVFPHGDNEIAIAEGLTGKPLANYWLHSEIVTVNGRKVARPGGADLTLDHLLEQGLDPKVIRYWLLSQHYDRMLTYGEDQISQAKKSVERLNDFAARVWGMTPGQAAEDLDQIIFDAKTAMQEAMDYDFNLPRAMGHLFAFIKKINNLMQKDLIDATQKLKILGFLNSFNRILGVIDFNPPEPDAAVEGWIAKRDKARAAGDFQTADEIRDKLAAMGVKLTDTPRGTIWRKTGLQG